MLSSAIIIKQFCVFKKFCVCETYNLCVCCIKLYFLILGIYSNLFFINALCDFRNFFSKSYKCVLWNSITCFQRIYYFVLVFQSFLTTLFTKESSNCHVNHRSHYLKKCLCVDVDNFKYLTQFFIWIRTRNRVSKRNMYDVYTYNSVDSFTLC